MCYKVEAMDAYLLGIMLVVRLTLPQHLSSAH